jgi:hypothetical protein
MPAHFFQSQDILVKRNGFFQVGNTITGVEKLLDHVEKWHRIPRFPTLRKKTTEFYRDMSGAERTATKERTERKRAKIEKEPES